ncbi:MAG: hypothetical protein OXT69_10320 [Candidatus Poribacteria bacterium]|nr:hypothetical protein [Candidatus Poribacteria bacterium]
MRTRTLARIMLAAGVCVLLAFGYMALKYGGKPEQEPEIIQTPKTQPPAPEPESQVPVPTPLKVKPSVDPTESANAPDAPLDPDASAWEKVEHIRNNLHLYGTFHPDADEIIAQLWPPPEDFLNETGGLTESGEFIHDEEAGERVVALFDRLIALNDPRAAELIARYEYEVGRGGSSGWPRALVDLGAPSIPFLLDHVKMEDGTSRSSVAVQLKRIVNRHPDLDSDIVTDILEPLFEEHKWLIQQYQEMGIL